MPTGHHKNQRDWSSKKAVENFIWIQQSKVVFSLKIDLMRGKEDIQEAILTQNIIGCNRVNLRVVDRHGMLYHNLTMIFVKQQC